MEQALDRMPDPVLPIDRARRYAEIMALIDRIPTGSIMSMKEFDALDYDENGDPR